VTQRSPLVRIFNRPRLRDGSALSRGLSAEPEEPDDGGRLLDSNKREERDDDGRYYAPHEFDGRPDVYATGADPLLQALRREHPERDPCPTH